METEEKPSKKYGIDIEAVEKIPLHVSEEAARQIARDILDESDELNPKNPAYVTERALGYYMDNILRDVYQLMMDKHGKQALLKLLEKVKEGEADYDLESIMDQAGKDSISVREVYDSNISSYHRRARNYNGTDQFGANTPQETDEIMDTIDDETLIITRNYAVGALKKLARGSESNRYFRAVELIETLKEIPEVRNALHSRLKHLDEKERWSEIFKKIFSEGSIPYILEHNVIPDTENPEKIVADTDDILIKTLYFLGVLNTENVYRPTRINGNGRAKTTVA